VGGDAEGFYAAVELSDAEREELLQLCRQRLDAFRMQRGEEVGCLLTQKPAASGTGAATAPRSAARPKSGHGADGLALHQPEWSAVVEPIAERKHMSHAVKRFIGAEFTDVQCLTTNAFRFSSMRTWVSNRRFNSGRTRSTRAVRSWLPMLPVATIKSLAGVLCKR
jgi:hypothetical protein